MISKGVRVEFCQSSASLHSFSNEHTFPSFLKGDVFFPGPVKAEKGELYRDISSL